MTQPFPFFGGDVQYGQKPGIGLCTLWTPRQRYSDLIDRVQVIGNLYSRYGIGIMMRNVLARPELHTLVICGRDNPEPTRQNGEALLTRAVRPDDLALPSEAVEAFYARTRLIDARSLSPRSNAELGALLAAIPPPDAPVAYEPLVFPLPEPQTEVFPAARGVFTVRAPTIAAAHNQLLRDIRRFGTRTRPDREGHFRLELWQLTVHLYHDPENPLLGPVPFYDDEELDRYGMDLWEGTEPPETTYRYGYTMRSQFGDQIAKALDILTGKAESFRPVISLWEPYQSMVRDDEPCLITVHPRLRDGQLDLWAYIRTNEMFRAWPKNASGLRHLQAHMAGVLGVEMGDLSVTSGSAHIYDYDLGMLDAHLATDMHTTIAFDPRGDWRLTWTADHYVAEHYHNGALLQRLTAPTVTHLERKILPFITDTSHAVHIGRELARIEMEAEIMLGSYPFEPEKQAAAAKRKAPF
jgi:thymidylate synthase